MVAQRGKSREPEPFEVVVNDTQPSTIYNNLNDRLHELADDLMQEDANSPFDISELRIDECIEKFHPSVWEMAVMLTRTKKERKSSKFNPDPAHLTLTRKIRCFYILCLIMFTMNSRCSMPMHTLLTDIVESHGGSSELILILNRLGAISSADTHARYVNFVVQNTQDILHAFSLKVPFLASIDNLNWKQGWSQVYCGDQHHSTHCTTIQLAQQNSSHPKRKVPPFKFPPTTKKQRRTRTLSEDGVEVEDEPLLITEPPSSTEEEPTTSFDNLSLNYFHPSSDEVNELDKFNLFTFTHIKERVKITSPSHVHTPGMQSYLKASDIMHVHEQLPSTTMAGFHKVEI